MKCSNWLSISDVDYILFVRWEEEILHYRRVLGAAKSELQKQ